MNKILNLNMIGGESENLNPEYLRQVLKTAIRLSILNKMKQLGIDTEEDKSTKETLKPIELDKKPTLEKPINEIEIKKNILDRLNTQIKESRHLEVPIKKEEVKPKYKLTDNEKKVIKDYYLLKTQILSNIDQLRLLKQKKDELLGEPSNTPFLNYNISQQKSKLDDCIRDDSGNISIC